MDNDDLISRKDLLERIEKERAYLKARGLYGAEEILTKYLRNIVEDMPPAKEKPQSKWVKIFENPFTNGYVCPFCGHEIHVTEQFLSEVTECEACGADMRGEKNG